MSGRRCHPVAVASEPARVLILGLGNVLLTDEGVGAAVLQALAPAAAADPDLVETVYRATAVEMAAISVPAASTISAGPALTTSITIVAVAR